MTSSALYWFAYLEVAFVLLIPSSADVIDDSEKEDAQ